MRVANVLSREYDSRLREHGDSALGVHWPNEEDRRTRYDVMLDVIEPSVALPVTFVDLGCGTGGLLGHLQAQGDPGVRYRGADSSALALSYARQNYPDGEFETFDIGDTDADFERLACDYLVANGLFTVLFDASYAQMWQLLERTVRGAWPFVRRGIAFNLMSKAVDWERDDLFHVPMDDVARLLHELAGRRVRFRADYGLYEYTAYAFRPSADSEPDAER